MKILDLLIRQTSSASALKASWLMIWIYKISIALVFAWGTKLAIAENKTVDNQFMNLSIEELMNVKVTT
ncbi:MAG: hypothetical protein Q8K47_01680, partial [Nitrosomonas sp.]|nr:hypothetical protein [Nitrosomonas sp.]